MQLNRRDNGSCSRFISACRSARQTLSPFTRRFDRPLGKQEPRRQKQKLREETSLASAAGQTVTVSSVVTVVPTVVRGTHIRHSLPPLAVYSLHGPLTAGVLCVCRKVLPASRHKRCMNEICRLSKCTHVVDARAQKTHCQCSVGSTVCGPSAVLGAFSKRSLCSVIC